MFTLSFLFYYYYFVNSCFSVAFSSFFLLCALLSWEAEQGSLSGRPASCLSALGEEALFPHSWVLWDPQRTAHVKNGCLVIELADAPQLRAEGCLGLCHFVNRQLHVCWLFLSGERGKEGRKGHCSLSFHLHSWTQAFLSRSRVIQFQVSNVLI